MYNQNGYDWRVDLFGSHIRRNTSVVDEEDGTTIPLQQAFKGYDYIAVFIGADYCPSCKEFAPTVISSSSLLESEKKCKTIFVSNDRDERSYNISLKKNLGIDAILYDLERTAKLRDLFGLKTIPALMILKNDNFASETPTVLSNARHALVTDPRCDQFPWAANQNTDSETGKIGRMKKMSKMDRFIIRGEYGNWWDLGHRVNPEKPDEMYMDEHAVRARAGILNLISWIAIMNTFHWKNFLLVPILFPTIAWEMYAAMNFGLTPLAPVSVLGTLVAMLLHDEPHWKPAKPKRFAWGVGLGIAITCVIFFYSGGPFGNWIPDHLWLPLISSTILICNFFTWLESSCGFCVGCWVYNRFITKWYGLEECKECQM